MKAKKDVLIPLTPPCKDHGQLVVRVQDGSSNPSLGLLQQVKEGTMLPAGAEIINVRARSDGAYEVQPLAAGDGPAQVATEAYRDNYSRIFGAKQRGPQYLN